MLICYVDHHDKAYAWAERRRIEAHPRTGTIQIVEVRERVEEDRAAGDRTAGASARRPAKAAAGTAVRRASDDDMLGVGVPEDWIETIRAASEDGFLELADHLPPEAAEALLEYAATGIMPTPARCRHRCREPRAGAGGRADSRFLGQPGHLAPLPRRRERRGAGEGARLSVGQVDGLPAPVAAAMVDQIFTGPAKVAGSAGTGKTVVALHRAARLAADPDSRVLLTTFSQPLANALRAKLAMLVGEQSPAMSRVTIAPFRGIAEELYQLAFGRRPQIASDEQIAALLAEGGRTQTAASPSRFLMSEWTNVVDAWQIDSAEAYAEVPRLGRKNRLGAKQRARLWPIFDAPAQGACRAAPADLAAGVRRGRARSTPRDADKPFTSIVVDEAQDLGVPELRFLAAIAGERAGRAVLRRRPRPAHLPAAVLVEGARRRCPRPFAGPEGELPHVAPDPAGGRRPAAEVVRDVDGLVEERSDTVSVFNGPEPIISTFRDARTQKLRASRQFIRAGDRRRHRAVGDRRLRALARTAEARAGRRAQAAGLESFEISEVRHRQQRRACRSAPCIWPRGWSSGRWRSMACDDELLPLAARIETVADEVELDEVYETERQLLYVACTRARDRLFVSGVAPGSEFLGDLAVRDGRS